MASPPSGGSGGAAQATAGNGGGGAGGQALEWASGVVDAHTHFWDLERNPAFSNGKSELPVAYAELAKPAGISGAILIEAVWQSLEDNLWGLQLADQNPIVAGVIGQLSLASPSFADDLGMLAQNPRFRGLRVSTSELPSQNLALLAERGLVVDVDVAGSVEKIRLVAQSAGALPKLKLVIDHAGSLSFAAAPSGEAAAALQLAAASPNVFCKVSRFQEQSGAQPAPTDAAAYTAMLDFLFATFGEDRLLFGSNWPLSEQAGSLSSAVDVLQTYLQNKDARIAHKLLSANAVSFYGNVQP